MTAYLAQGNLVAPGLQGLYRLLRRVCPVILTGFFLLVCHADQNLAPGRQVMTRSGECREFFQLLAFTPHQAWAQSLAKPVESGKGTGSPARSSDRTPPSREDLGTLAKKYLSSMEVYEGKRLEVKVLRVYFPPRRSFLEQPAGSEIMGTVEFLPAGKLPGRGGVSSLPFHLRTAGGGAGQEKSARNASSGQVSGQAPLQPAQRGYLTVQIKVVATVAIASQEIKPGEGIEEKVVFEDRDLLTLPQDLAESPELLKGMVARVLIPKGSPVTRRMVDRPVMVRRGDLVMVRVLSGSVQVSSTGEAMSDGHEGEIIKVRMENGVRIISGKIKDKGLVVIELPKEGTP